MEEFTLWMKSLDTNSSSVKDKKPLCTSEWPSSSISSGGHAEGHISQLALGGRQHLAHSLCSSGGAPHNVTTHRPSFTPVLGRDATHGLLSGGVGLDGGHHALLNSYAFLQEHVDDGAAAGVKGIWTSRWWCCRSAAAFWGGSGCVGAPCRPAPCPSSAGATPGAAGATACATAGGCCNFSHSARMRPAAAASLRWRVFPAVQPATIWPSKARAKMCVATRNSRQRPSHSAADAQANA